MLSIKKVFAHSIKRIFSVVFLTPGILTFIATGQTPNATDIRPLPLNKTVEREIKAAEEHFCTIKLKQGEVLRLELQEGQEVNYVFRLLKADDGQTITESDLTTKFGREAITYIAAAKESLKVLVKAPEKITGSAAYKLRGTVSKRATARDKERIKAEELSKEAAKLSNDALKLPVGNKTESYRKAVTLAEEALMLRRKQADKYWEGWTLHFLGNLYIKLGDKRKALDYYNQTLQAIIPDNKTLEAGILKDIARIYTNLHDYNKANDYHNRALVIFRSIGDKDREAQTLLVLAQSYLNITSVENIGKAIESYNQLVEIYRNIKDEKREASTLLGIGNIFLTYLRDNRKALDYYNQSLSVYRKIGDEKWAAWILEAIGKIYVSFVEIQKALDYYNQSLSVYRKIGDKKGEARMLIHIGNTYGNSADRQKQFENYDQSLSIYRSIGDKDNEANLLIWVGDSYYRISNKEKKWLDYYTQALSIYRNDNNKAEEFLTLTGIGWKFNHSGDYQQALEYYNQALSVHELNSKEISNDELSNLYGTIGGLYGYLGNKNKQTEYINKSKLLSPSYDGSNVSEASSLRTKGLTFEVQKEYQKALEHYKQALNIYRDKGTNTTRVEKILQNDLIIRIIKIYGWLGDKEKQLDYENQALALLKNFDDPLRKFIFLQDIAVVNRDLGNYQKAIEFLNRALDFSDIDFGKESPYSISLIKTISSVYQAWGRSVYKAWGDKPKAIEYLNKALSIYRARGVKNMGASALESIGYFYLALNEYQTAILYLNQALQIHTSEGTKPQIADALHQLMFVCKIANNYPAAIFYGKQSVNNYQELRQSTRNLDKETQKSYLGKVEPTYRLLADILISEGRLPEAQAVLDLLKEQEFKDITVRRSGEIPDTIPYSKAESDVATKVENLAKSERELADLLKLKEQGALPPDKQSRLDQIPTEIEAANRAFRLALDALGKSESSVETKVAEIKSEQNLQRALAQLQKETGSSVVALYTVLGTEDSNGGENTGERAKTKFGWIILVTPNLRKAYPIDVAELEQIVFALRETLQSDKYDPQPLAEKLYQKLFRQTSPKQKTTLEADLETLLGSSKDKTLMWSLDGILRYVPMAALHDGKGYLVEKYRSVIFTKESFLTLTEKDTPNWQALGLGVSEKRDGFDSLPGAERELKDVVREANNKTGILNGKIKLNKDFAEEETLRLWREGSFQVVHIASHYSFNATDPTSSFLLVGDGRLSFSEMQDKDNLFGSVDLLTLSACDTAMTSNGKEAEGFAYLAQSLGAKSVIASLWKVSDAGTPELMIRFYKLRTENPNISKGEAFRQAQLSLLNTETGKAITSNSRRSEIVTLSGKKGELPLYEKTAKSPFSHPHYWSSFILIGNWR